ncbi:MAG: putative cell division FtsK/SpoIIIE [Parcubacteria group bacterium Gr01-1014_107]|nr:MAG: putative cell division FtsK/SpoIIIE [Parcubacteria group bacterium Gr01-1014_107]
MAKKKRRDGENNNWLKKETVQSVLAVVFFVLTIFLLMAYFNKSGEAGEATVSLLLPVLGWGYFILPILLTILGVSFLTSVKKSFAIPQIIGGLLFFLAGLSLLDLVASGKGGYIGLVITKPIISLFDQTLSVILVSSLLLISSLVIFDSALRLGFLLNLLARVKDLISKRTPAVSVEEGVIKVSGASDDYENKIEEEKDEKKASKETLEKTPSKEVRKTEELPINLSKISLGGRVYKPPPLELLSRDQGKPGVGDIKANANIIKRTLQNFGISVEMDEITIGPTVTRYALKPAEGVKLSRIVGLQNDLALALAAHPLRIEAPIPGKSLVGIEIPNNIKTTVGLGSLLAEEEFQKSSRPLLLTLGRAISGKPHFDDLSKMPHLLIAGATGSGKSVLIHAIITSLLYKNSPENLKFILIDPKRVELTLYNRIPHLLTPVLTDPKKAILALKWAAKEMDRRYDILESEKVRDISSYHKNRVEPELKKRREKKDIEEEFPESMPYIAIVLDELADIMSTYPRELEASIVRLAQMSRAVGIHLILSTQRPSVNIITGLIKANISTRIALQVVSQVDSRTILDMGGAEKLLGAGDMLYLSGEMSKPQRFQAAFISETEVKDIVKYLTEHYRESEDLVDFTSKNLSSQWSSEVDNIDDELYKEARELVTKAGKASTSYLQRRLRVGYARAARLIDMLEERGVVGPGEGAKPREVIESYQKEEAS